MNDRLPAATLIVCASLLVACASGPRAIHPGDDHCAYCRMQVSDVRFATELVTPRGRVHVFDSIECLVRFMADQPTSAGEGATIWVTDYDDGSRLLPAREAAYLEGGAVRSPMGLGVAAFPDVAARDAAAARLGARPLTWQGVARTIADQWSGFAPTPAMPIDAPRAPEPTVADEEAPATPATIGAHGATTLSEAIARAAPGEVLIVPPGHYREPTLVIDKPLELIAEPGVVLDGEGERGLIEVLADDVTVRGFELRNVGVDYIDDRAAIYVGRVRGCRIEQNEIDEGFFGIYLARADGCEIRENRLSASSTRETASGNGIHLWYSNRITIEDNVVEGYRDGIYFEFVEGSRVARNISRSNLRYGLHFMFSDDCHYEDNRFESNGAGVAVMYTSAVRMTGNTFADNWGSASFGLLLKDIRDSRIVGNVFRRNSVGLYAEGSDRLIVADNDFDRNGWAVKLFSNSEDDHFTANNFVGNSFDVATNSRHSYSTFEGNYWERYRGHDLDHDGIGDAPFRPVRLFSLLVERNEPSLILLRSFLVQLLDAAEEVIPALTPETLIDAAPLMAPARSDAAQAAERAS